MTWQPIETAPKGETVLIYTPTIGIETAIQLEAVKRDQPEGTFFLWFVGQSMKNGGASGYSPTHWMPLPPIPTNAEI